METSRRNIIGKGTTIAVTAWVAPSVLTLEKVYAATGSSINCETPSVGGGASWIAPPTTIAEGTPTLDSNSTSWVFPESGPLQLAADLTVNRTVAGIFGGSSNESAVVAAGTWVCSYYVHGDRLDDNGMLTGQMQFSSSTIIGLIYQSAELTASQFLGSPTTTYFPAPMEAQDQLTLNLTPGSNVVTWQMMFGGALDGIRVITTCG